MRRELPAWTGLAMMTWLSLVLWLDRTGGGGGLWQQRGLGVLTWVVLAVVLVRVSATVRAQTAVVVGFATAVEYTFAAGLEVYTYRFDNVPAYVPPGHGLVYLSAFALGHAGVVQAHRRAAVGLVVAVGGLWAAYGVLLAERPDALGAFWYACLVGFVFLGPSQPVYLGAFVAVSWLELVGTHLGTWTWGTLDPTGWVSIGNPPSGAAGGYGWFDLAGLLAAPAVLAACRRVRRAGRSGRPRSAGPGRRAEPVGSPADGGH